MGNDEPPFRGPEKSTPTPAKGVGQNPEEDDPPNRGEPIRAINPNQIQGIRQAEEIPPKIMIFIFDTMIIYSYLKCSYIESILVFWKNLTMTE